MDLIKAGNYLEANSVVVKEAGPAYAANTAAMQKLLTLQIDIAAQEYGDAVKSNAATRNFSIVTIVVGILLAVLIGVLLIRNIVRSLNTAQRIAGAIATGDLSSNIDTNQKDEIGVLLYSMKTMQDSLRAIVTEIRNIVEEAAVRGSFGTKMNMNGKAGYTKELSELLNQLSNVTEESLTDISRVAQALADGDLAQNITKNYPGLFGQTAQGVNGTVHALNEIVSDIQFVALSAGQGDFSTKLNMDGKVGYNKTLSGLMNQLSAVTEDGLMDIIRVAKALAAGDLTQTITRIIPVCST